MDEKTNWETINAYVDGELSSKDAAEVAKAVASNPHTAREVAALSALKASIAATSPHFEMDRVRQPDRPRLRVALVAAMLLLTVGAMIFATAWHTGRFLESPGIELAVTEHANWLQLKARTRTQSPELVRTSLEGLRLDAYVPDLAQVQLTFSGVRRVPARGGEGVHVGYLGPSGCSVSLVMFKRHGEFTGALQRIEREGRSVYAWRSGGSVYYLLAHGMDPNRLEKVAATVHRLTRQRLPLDPRTAIALNEARASAQPCIA